MSPRKVEARLLADAETTGDVRAVQVFGHTLTTEFAELEVTEGVFGKLRANPHVEIKGEEGQALHSPLDHDGDGEDGGSLTVAELKAALDDLGVEYPARANHAALTSLLAQAEAAAAQA
jgi:hypothetical protein